MSLLNEALKAAAEECDALQDRVRELESGIRALFDAPHYEHFSVRLNEKENAALENLRRLVAPAKPKKRGK